MNAKGDSSNVLIVGSGPAGIEAARALSLRGYDVAIAEARGEIGGRVARERLLPGLSAKRASFSSFQFGAYLSASSYFASASRLLPCFTSTSPQAFKGSAQCGPRLLASLSFS